METIDEALKNAIANNDINFLVKNKDLYNINHRFVDESNDTLLLYSISDKASEVYNFFLKNEADVNLVNDEDENIIHSIVYSGDPRRLKLILDNYNIDINQKSKDGTTPLLLSALLGKFEIFNLLLEYKADIGLADDENNTPLHVASDLGYLKMVYKLVELGADFNIKTNKGNLPLALAVNGRHHEIVKFLFQKIYGVLLR